MGSEARCGMPPLEETFAGMAGRMRVVDMAGVGRPASSRFAVMALPLLMPAGRPDLEFELCAVAYRPHAEAIAALPELVEALHAAERGLPRNCRKGGLAEKARRALEDAIAKAEGRPS